MLALRILTERREPSKKNQKLSIIFVENFVATFVEIRSFFDNGSRWGATQTVLL